MARRCKNKCGAELPPAAKSTTILEKQGYCSDDCKRAHAQTKKQNRQDKTAKPKKPKRKSPAQEAENVAKRLQLLVRLKAADDNGYCQCVTCGKIDHYKNLQGGHFISRRYSYHKLREENLASQCPACNGPLRGNLTNYTLYMIDYYGRDFVEWLEETKSQGVKWDREKLAEQLKDINEQIAFHKNRIGED